jgi:hypothetical protein
MCLVKSRGFTALGKGMWRFACRKEHETNGNAGNPPLRLTTRVAVQHDIGGSDLATNRYINKHQIIFPYWILVLFGESDTAFSTEWRW